jgi:uncharacterized lipoprotein
MKKITTIAVATALLGLAACSADNATTEAENAAVTTEEAAPADEAAPAEVTAEGDAEQPN